MKICDFFEVDVYSLLDDVNNVNFSNSHFKGLNYVINPNNSTINFNDSPHIVNELLNNQSRLSSLLDYQNTLIEKLLNNNS